jgi:hypothetical protein
VGIYQNHLKYKLLGYLKLISAKVFYIILSTGTINKKCAKYNTVLICPNSIKGDSTCLAPNCIKTKKFATKI